MSHYASILIKFLEPNMLCDSDGFYKLFLETKSGAGTITAFDLRILADELDRKNLPIKQDLNKYFGENDG